MDYTNDPPIFTKNFKLSKNDGDYDSHEKVFMEFNELSIKIIELFVDKTITILNDDWLDTYTFFELQIENEKIAMWVTWDENRYVKVTIHGNKNFKIYKKFNALKI